MGTGWHGIAGGGNSIKDGYVWTRMAGWESVSGSRHPPVVCQHTYVEGVQSIESKNDAEVLIEEIRRLFVDGSAGIQIALVPFLSNADPLKTWRASFEAQRGNRVRPGRFWPSSPNVSVYHLYHPSPSPSQPPSSSSPLSHTRSLPPSIFPSPDFHAACPTPSSIYYFFLSPLSPQLTHSSPSASLAFSTLADPCLWPAPSPLDSPDPLDAFDSILYPTFEREIVSGF